MEIIDEVESVCQDMKEMLLNQVFGKVSENNLQSQDVNQSTLANKVRTLIQNTLSDDIEKELNQISEINSENWKSFADDITNSLMNSASMVCVQENINNMLETCTQELITDYASHGIDSINLLESVKFNDDENLSKGDQNAHSNNFAPILQPYQYMEIAHNILPQKPLYVRIQAFDVLLSSQLTDAVSNLHWPSLQKSLQNVLSDDHFDVFHACIQVHAKLITNTSPEGIKESFLNILESLGQHYFTQKLECNEIDVQIPAHYRIVRLCNLMLDCIKETIQNLPRIGEKRLTEMIDNFIHLISLHGTSTRIDEKTKGLNIFDIVSCLDPEANWFKYLSHNAMSRKIILLKMSQNCCLLRIIIEEIIKWFNNPLFSDEDISNGIISENVCKFSKFIHCLSLISRTCTFDTGRNLFPVALNKDEEPIRIQKIIAMILKFLNRQQIIEEQLEIIFSDSFIKFMINCVESLMNFKDISNYNVLNLLQILFEPLTEKPGLPPQHTVLILTVLSKHPEGAQNYFFKYGLNNKKKNITLNVDSSNLKEQNPNITSNNQNLQPESRQNNKELKINHIGQLMAMKSTIDSFTLYSFCPIKILTNVAVSLLKTKELRDRTVTAKLLTVCGKLFQTHEGVSILESIKSQLIHNAALIYQELIDITRKEGGFKILEERNFYLLFSSIENFIILIGTTPLGFYLIQEEDRMLADCFTQMLQQPKIYWENAKWRLFVTYASSSHDGVSVLRRESKNLIKEVLLNLWAALSNDIVSDSSIEIEEAVNFLMICVSTFGTNLKGVKALFDDINRDGDDNADADDLKSEETLIENTESIPEEITSLVIEYALKNDSFNYKAHEIALIVFNLLVSNINCLLYLESKLQFQNKLLSLQSDERISDSLNSPSTNESNLSLSPSSTSSLNQISDIIIDECSLLRHGILERVYSLGQNANSRNKIDVKLYYQCPPLSSSQMKARTRPRTHGELSKFLQDTRNGLHDVNWLKQARKAYRGGNNDEIKCSLLIDLIEQVQRAVNNGSSSPNCNENNGDGFKWYPSDTVDKVELFPEDYVGIQIAIRYGAQHRLIQVQSMSQSSDNLALLLKLTRLSLFTSDNLPQEFYGFDWFLASIYLICGGNVEKCQYIISSLMTFPSIVLIWDQYALSVRHSSAFFGHMLETLIKCEMPLVFYALQENGMSWWVLCDQWIRECFWCVLDWNQICHWLIFCVLHQPDYIVYLCIGLLHQIEQKVLEDSNNGSLWKLITCPPDKFCITEHLPYMDKLWRRHHSNIAPYLEMFPLS